MEKYSVSRETLKKLELYNQMLIEWQNKFNLVSNSSVENAWKRHFEDSAQLFKCIPDGAKTLIDFGSGAGFPAMVIAIMADEKTPYLKITMVESIGKKTLFLNAVADATNTSVAIISDRIENISLQKFDVITSRAMTSLKRLLDYSYDFCHKDTVCIFPKGKKYALELSEAHKFWKFKCRIVQSNISEEGKILIINNISKKRRK